MAFRFLVLIQNRAANAVPKLRSMPAGPDWVMIRGFIWSIDQRIRRSKLALSCAIVFVECGFCEEICQ
jgi:hypothetical protein